MKTSQISFDFFDEDNLAGARAVIDWVDEVAPYLDIETHPQEPNESKNDYQERRAADIEFGKLVKTVRLSNNSIAAMLIRIKHFIMEGYIVNATTTRKSKSNTPAAMIQNLYESAGLDISISQYKWSQLNSYITRVIPALMSQGIEIKDDWLIAIFDDTGNVQIPEVIKHVIQLLSQKEGFTKDEAELAASALDDNYEARQKIAAEVAPNVVKLPATEETLPDGAGRIIVPYTNEAQANVIRAALRKFVDLKPY